MRSYHLRRTALTAAIAALTMAPCLHALSVADDGACTTALDSVASHGALFALTAVVDGYDDWSWWSGGSGCAALLPMPEALESEARVRAYVDATAHSLDARIRTTLPKLIGLPRQLLALKYYLTKTRRDIRARWVWTASQVNRFRKTAAYQTMLAEVEKLRATFAELNPGYTLRVDTDIRTLAEQINNWNQTPSVATAAASLWGTCLKTLADTAYAPMPDPASVTRFRSSLLKAKLPLAVTVAVPGFSEHGQLRAFDFVIVQGNRIIAGTDAASARSVWDRPGWTTKLKEAVKTSGTKFVGPLTVPREPWHYSYRP